MGIRTSPALANRSPLKVLLIFFITVFIGITYWLHPASRAVQGPLELFLAWVAGTILSWFDSSVSIDHATIIIEGFTANIVPACTGLFTMTIYAAAVLAYPCRWTRKAQGLLLGVVGIIALNSIRIVSLLLIGAYWTAAFDFAHLVVWQSVAIAFAAFLWLYWVQRVAHAR